MTDRPEKTEVDMLRMKGILELVKNHALPHSEAKRAIHAAKQAEYKKTGENEWVITQVVKTSLDQLALLEGTFVKRNARWILTQHKLKMNHSFIDLPVASLPKPQV